MAPYSIHSAPLFTKTHTVLVQSSAPHREYGAIWNGDKVLSFQFAWTLRLKPEGDYPCVHSVWFFNLSDFKVFPQLVL